ncbi:hypothetical protein [Pseudenhygromyxa sp. WMMC2535]|nr:hypothetical protein [Pseudenhygromyxa sp. WMMC2535]
MPKGPRQDCTGRFTMNIGEALLQVQLPFGTAQGSAKQRRR